MGHKICPICATPAHEQAAECSVCGAALDDVQVVEQRRVPARTSSESYDFHYGETDLSERNLHWRGGTYLLAGMLVLSALVCVAGVYIGAMRMMSAMGLIQEIQATPTLLATASEVPGLNPLVTNTPRPTLFLPTVTVAEPTEVILPTETPGPCMQTVQSGDSLIGLVSRCGHRDLAVIDIVLELNDLASAEMLQAGQTIEIPWPTPTPDVEDESADDDSAEGEQQEEASSLEDEVSVASIAVAGDAESGVPDPFVRPTETLQPGVTWHTIASGENIISIAVQYGADVKILSELNPEITFSQCDFGQFGGGPNCTVILISGQQLRVPAPTPTPTLSPTPSGSETPTPTATPTFNAPSPLSPSNRVLFQASDLITLRWVASGTLAPGQVYQVQVEDLTEQIMYTEDTTDLFFVIPEAWQSRDGTRHEYRWVVSVVDTDDRDNPYFVTEPRTFTWEGRDES